MDYFKANVDFSQYSDADVSATATGVHGKMTLNAATFTDPPVSMAQLKTDNDDYIDKLGKAQLGGSDRVTLKNDARAKVEKDLFKLATYVNLVADGNKAIIDLSGFPSYSTARVQSTGGVDFVPLNVRCEQGTVSGAAALRWKGDGKGSMYEVQTCTGDPNVDANWHYRGSFSGGRAELDGFTPGTIIWGRVRKIGTGGEVGNWSDPAQIRAN